MILKFIGQGLDPESNSTAGNFIINTLENSQYNYFSAFVAFVSTGGLRNIIEQLIKFKDDGGNIRLYVGVNLNATSKEALEKLMEHEIETYVVYSPSNVIYHPKIYAFEGNNLTRTIIGSSNLTESGLFQNIEASVCVDFDNNDKEGKEFLAEIYDHFNSIISHEHPSCQPLTQEVLDILVENNVVLSEALITTKINKEKKDFGQKEAKKNAKLMQLFGKIKSKRPPRGFRKSVIKKRLHKKEDSSDVLIFDELTELPSGSLWIETGAMTGGSRNILDLSKSGEIDGEIIFGSISYFGLDPDNTNETKDINLILNDKNYQGNHIFYAEGNSNWRIRLNGEANDGEKITVFSKPSLGSNGGFQYKILLFTKIDDLNFKLEIIEQDEISRLIENSSEWGKGGRGGKGRAYGIIS